MYVARDYAPMTKTVSDGLKRMLLHYHIGISTRHFYNDGFARPHIHCFDRLQKPQLSLVLHLSGEAINMHVK